MSQKLADWAFFEGEAGRCWLSLSADGKVTERERAPSRAVYGIASHDIVSSPQWVNSREDEIISQVLEIENEKLGLSRTPGPGKVSAWEQVDTSETQSLVQSLTIPWSLDEIRQSGIEFTGFVPQFALFSPPSDRVVLWQESGGWVAGYSRGTNWIHLQTDVAEHSPEELAREIGLTVIELNGKGVIATPREIVVWGHYDIDLHRALEQGTDFTVSFEKRPAPLRESPWTLEPHEVTLAKMAKTSQKRSIGFAVLALFLVAALAAAGFIQLWLLEQSNTRLETKVANNREAAAQIEETIEKWQALSPAIDSRRSPLELFHQVSTLLPAEGFRLTSFEIQNFRTVILRGEASTMANALQVKGALERAEGLSDYEWEVPQPTSKDNLTGFTATGIYRY